MIYQIYCDESCQSENRYMVIGGLIIRQSNVQRFNDTMLKYRKSENMWSELKWTKVTNQKYAQYETFVDYFFALNNADLIHFHSLIIDNNQVDHRRFNDGDKEAGFYKFYYQLLFHCFGKKYCVNPRIQFVVHLDQRQTKYKLDNLKRILNLGLRKSGVIHSPFVSIEPRNSKECELIQINDLLIGAIGSQKNGRHLLAGSRVAKTNLAAHIADKAGLKNLTFNTTRGQNRFTIWNFRLSK